ncbi:imidazole glycerol phosphate synthase cyclase subunit [Pseudodesulfovibrio sp. zrk46]|uniref:imidazole glycerol phosphate synthase subunit HisF n=1 Tax=Pseudodesulfovibrio sp. zrk46 TaxID=2725288 RepID=UPI001448ADC9|nr:imidazole glycerol phosphate synthase cyclase subunit [Pseudodesulfovibrio sp. zrk46]QJB58055.1 imidazole glycerol phosphate synthase subunit HisF [Pseudodesulfovibrio sp. zrk46]
MLKTRIIPTLLYRDYGLVKGVAFDSWRHVGSLMQSIKVYNMRNVDELIIVDIKATNDGRKPDFGWVNDFADDCFMPLTVGGGVTDIDHVGGLLDAGADKVAMNTAAVDNPILISQVANKYGSQCAIVSIDFKRHEDGYLEVVTNSGKNQRGIDLVEFAKEAESRGAGEILMTSVELDGTMKGYDLEAVKAVSDAVSIPVIASGGAGNYEHMLQAIQQGGATAVAAASIFHFTEQTPAEARSHLRKAGIPVRKD